VTPAAPHRLGAEAKPLVAARAAVAAGRLDEALVILKRAVQTQPSDPDAWRELIALYDGPLGDPSRAREYRSLFRDRFPASTPSSVPERSGGPPTASASHPTPPAPAAERDTARAMQIWGQGLERHNAADWNAAAGLYRQALRLDDRLISASFNLGVVSRELADWPQALDAFRRTLAIKPDMVEARYMLGLVYRDMKNLPRAREETAKALEQDPDHAKAHFLMALIEEAAGRPDAARQHFSRYLQLAPDGPSASHARQWLRQHPKR
jgi:tetratricopeptide (TPR) repeat protein